jgi:very-short-patch-repair endonuclease
MDGRCGRRESETEIMAQTPKIYLAGRVSKNDWRHELGVSIRGKFHSSDLPQLYSEGFPEQPATFNGHPYIYVGPWFVCCDHGGFHGASTHGVGLGMDRDEHAGVCCESQLPDGWSEMTARRALVDLCVRAIKSSSIVVAWLEDLAYGTVAELGYAHACGRPIAIGGPAASHTGDLWFPTGMASQVFGLDECPTPVDLFKRVVGIVSPLTVCESPMEERMLAAFKSAGFSTDGDSSGASFHRGALSLNCQTEVPPYRLDFSVQNKTTNAKIAVEVDGHDFHERTKEQASRDRARDRFLQSNGWKVFRFTGSDVHRNASSCVSEVISAAEAH